MIEGTERTMLPIAKYIFILATVVIAGGAGGYFISQKKLMEAPAKQEEVTLPSQAAQEQETAEIPKSGVGVVDLSGRGLTEFPKTVLSKTNITTLVLSNNSIKTLPSEIGKLTDLEELYLDNNLLEGALVAEIRKMTKLRVLDARNNNMTGIPAEIGQMRHLITLDLSGNNIDTMPDEIKNISGNLKTLDLTGNPYSQDTLTRIRGMLPRTTVIH